MGKLALLTASLACIGILFGIAGDILSAGHHMADFNELDGQVAQYTGYQKSLNSYVSQGINSLLSPASQNELSDNPRQHFCGWNNSAYKEVSKANIQVSFV